MKYLYVLFVLTLNFACAGNKTAPKTEDLKRWGDAVQSDTMPFKSGVRSLFEDSSGFLWMGSNREGLCVYDGSKFYHWTQENGLLSNQIVSIQQDKENQIWVETLNGVSRFEKGKWIAYPNDKSQTLVDWQFSTGDLWFLAGNKEGVNRFNGEIMQFLPLENGRNESFDTHNATGIVKGEDSTVWIATYSALFRYNGEVIQKFSEADFQLNPTEKLHIRSVLLDTKGRLWIGNNGIGVLVMEGDKVQHFSKEQGLIHPNSKKSGSSSPMGTLEHVFAIEEDAQGAIWFGDRDTGIWKYEGKTMTNYPIYKDPSKHMVWSILCDAKGRLWVGMENSPLYRLNGNAFEPAF